MANRARLRISGLSELREAVRVYGSRVVEDAQAAVTTAVDQTVQMAKAAAPVKDGTLRDSIGGTVRTDGYSVTGTVRARAPHAHLLEFGTERIRKRPHLVPAAILARRRLSATLNRTIVARSPDGLGTPRLTGEQPSMPSVGIT